MTPIEQLAQQRLISGYEAKLRVMKNEITTLKAREKTFAKVIRELQERLRNDQMTAALFRRRHKHN